MDRQTLNQRASTVAGIYSTIARVVVIFGALAVIVGFIQAIAGADDVFVGIMAGLLVSFGILVYVVVAWAGIQMFALVAGYIQNRSAGDI